MSDQARAATHCDASDGVCHVCSDEAIIGRILEIDEQSRTAVVAMGAGASVVALDLVEAHVGDDVLVHMGFAIDRVDPT